MATNTAFQEGDRVRSAARNQGLSLSDVYTVERVEVQRIPVFGDLVTYYVRGSDTVLRAVRNGHLVLRGA